MLNNDMEVGVLTILKPGVQVSVGRILADTIGADVAQVLLHGVVGVQVLKVGVFGDTEVAGSSDEIDLKLRGSVGSVRNVDRPVRAVGGRRAGTVIRLELKKQLG